MNRQPRIQQLYRDLAIKMQLVRINNGTAEMFKPNAMASARPAARAAFARYLRAERAVMLFTYFNTPWPNSPWALPVSLPAPGTSPLDGVYVQLCGRIKRRPQPVHCYLENPLTGEKIKDLQLPVDRMSAAEWAEMMLGKPSYSADCVVCQESTHNYDKGGAPICPACETVQFERKIAGDQLGPEANAEQLDIYNSYRMAKGLDPVTTWRRPR